jgi:D-alanyl-D-alanine dipeptidase
MCATTVSNGGPLKKKPSAPNPASIRCLVIPTARPLNCRKSRFLAPRGCASRRSGESALDCHSERSEEPAFSSLVIPAGRPSLLAHALAVILFALLAFAHTPSLAQTSPAPFPGPEPANVPQDFIGKTGDFANQAETEVIVLLERSKHLYLRDSEGTEHLVNALGFSKEGEQTSFTYASNESDAWVLAFKQRKAEPVWQIVTQVGPYHRLPYSVPGGNVSIVKPTRPIAEIRSEALAASPPQEKGPFRNSDLVELAKLDPAIHLDIRYATANDFLGRAVYTQPRAFLQRPAAEALVRALHRLQPYGYGLLIHDGYRPWYVTKIFWDATPPDGKIFVADPAQGSRHNRGCAVDLTLYDLKTNEPLEMTGLYDEMSPRSFPDYPGGTSLQRWHRDLLRWAMESEGFTVFEFEWWHFDYKDWREYAIGNIPFEQLDAHPN